MNIAIWIELISISKCSISIGIDIEKSVTICSPNDGGDDGDGDGDGDGDEDPCKNALTAPEPLLASARSFSNISTILVLKNT